MIQNSRNSVHNALTLTLVSICLFLLQNNETLATRISLLSIIWRFCSNQKLFNNQLSGDFVVAEQNNRLYGQNNPLKSFIFVTIMLEL